MTKADLAKVETMLRDDQRIIMLVNNAWCRLSLHLTQIIGQVNE
jgi:hypothetical protein